jgi:hypothetical protein
MNRSYDESIQMEDDDMNTINQSRWLRLYWLIESLIEDKKSIIENTKYEIWYVNGYEEALNWIYNKLHDPEFKLQDLYYLLNN